MRKFVNVVICLSGMLAAVGIDAGASATPKSDSGSIVIVFKDGHTQSIPLASIARMDFTAAASAASASVSNGPPSGPVPSKKRFTGKWKVGDGNGSTFIVDLKENGEATKSVGSSHGTWTYVNGEAHIAWDDGWHDVIRKAGTKYEKFAFEPGKSLTDTPSNVTEATAAFPEPI